MNKQPVPGGRPPKQAAAHFTRLQPQCKMLCKYPVFVERILKTAGISDATIPHGRQARHHKTDMAGIDC